MCVVRVVIVVIALLAGTATAADFHFSVLGNDSAGDGSLANPWKSLAKLNSLDLTPGDNVLFRAGDTFAGNIFLTVEDSANDSQGVHGGNPISFAAYGAGSRPIIASATGNGLTATNVGGVEIRGLEFGGVTSLASIAAPSNNTKGLFFNNNQSAFQQQHIYLDDVVVHGFGEAGIQLHATNPMLNAGGFADVRVTNSQIHTNGRSGVVSSVSSTSGLVVGGTEYDFYARAHANFLVSGNVVRNTTGKAEAGGVSGNGIVLAQVDGATIERNVAHHNGGQAGGGGVGIWVWETDHAVIQHNEAYANQTFDGRDGGGFDLDGGVKDSFMQYNYSHGNEGAGLGLFQFGYASPMGGNSIRYNISEGDGAGISVWGNGPRFPGTDAAQDSIFHNNTLIEPKGPAVHFFGSIDDVGVYNNILVTADGEPLVQLDDWDGAGSNYVLDVDLKNNAYWSGGDPFLVEWGSASYGSLAAWANATGQEKIGGQLVGKQVDPLLVGPFEGGVTLDDPEQLATLAAYRLLASSPLVNAGRELSSLPLAVMLGLVDPGATDFFGGAIPAYGAFDLGAHEAFAPGDFNGDGTVDAADYAVWRDNFGTNNVLLNDPIGGMITQDQYDVWKSNFGVTMGPGSGASGDSQSVPEPAILGMLASVVFGCAVFTRHDRPKSSRQDSAGG
jgi:hypothetical protein